MSKILPATCVSKVVKCENVPVETAQILSEGNGESEGVLLLEDEKQFYLTSNATDLKETIDKLNQLIPKLVTIFTNVAAGMTGPTTAPPPTLGADLTILNQINSELTALKSVLK